MATTDVAFSSDNVNWKWGNNINIEKHYKKSHLFVLNSLYEGLPNVLIESVNNSLPCLSSLPKKPS